MRHKNIRKLNTACLLPYLLLFITGVLFSNTVFSVVFGNKVINNKYLLTPNNNGEFAINSDDQVLEKEFDINNDGFLEKVRVTSNLDSSLLSVELLLNNGSNIINSGNNFSSINLKSQSNIKLYDVLIDDLDNDGLKDMVFFTKIESQICQPLNKINRISIFKQTSNNEFQYISSEYFINIDVELFQNHLPKLSLVDIDGDSFLDLSLNNVSIFSYQKNKVNLINDKSFNFKPNLKSSLAFINNIQEIDFNNDGNQDFITSSAVYSNNNYHTCDIATDQNIGDSFKNIVWIGNGQGGFDSRVLTVFGGTIAKLIVVDINSDGFDDVFISKQTGVINGQAVFLSELYFGDKSMEYKHIYSFNQHFFDIDFVDINNNGNKDMVLLNGSELIIYSYIGEYNFSDVTFEFNNNWFTEAQFADMDNDGYIDMITGQSGFNQWYPGIIYNLGNNSFTELNYLDYDNGLFNLSSEPITINDIDNDGYKDILIGSVPKFKNKGQRNFIDISTSFDNIDFKNPSTSYKLSVDLNNNGKEDLIGISGERINGWTEGYSLSVLMHNNSNSKNFYNATSIKLLNVSGPFKMLPQVITTGDYDNDGMNDVIVAANGVVRILQQKPNPEIEDVYYDPNHSGHGYSIENVGRDNLYYTLFYSYNETGNSEWFLQLNKLRSKNIGIQLYTPIEDINSFNGSEMNYNYDYETHSAYRNLDENKLGLMQNSSDDNLNSNINLEFIFNNESQAQSWQSQRLIGTENKPENDFSGLWWAGIEDAGWGLSLNFTKRADRVDVFSVLYFYDANGKARWIVGQAGDFIPSQPLTIEMNMVNGYSREQNFVELTRVPAGTITINLDRASKDFAESGTMSMDVFYPRGQRRDWVRDDVPFALFSKPRD